MLKEVESLHFCETWELVELSRGKNAIGCKVVYRKTKLADEDL
jgi:hypothetical protein